MYHLPLIALGGALGAVSRYGLTLVVKRFAPGPFPWGTFFTNVIGCLLFGLVWTLLSRKVESPLYGAALLTGFMGAFTTFSTYMFETAALLEQERYLLAAGNFLGQNALGLGALIAGMALARQIA